MNDGKFWAAAALQGGGAGIAGDFLFADESRFGHNPVTSLAGPTAGLVSDIWELTGSNLKAEIAGEDSDFLIDMNRFAKSYAPGSSIWYARLALEREVFDQLDRLADGPGARKAWRRMQRKRAKDYRQGYWWKQGRRAPDRAPDLDNITD